jgi:hypothetical protein
MSKAHTQQQDHRRSPWNKGRLVGQKRPLKPKEVWNIRARLQIEAGTRDLAMFNLAIDSKLRGYDLVRLKIDDLCVGGRLRDRATIIQRLDRSPTARRWLTERPGLRCETLVRDRSSTWEAPSAGARPGRARDRRFSREVCKSNSPSRDANRNAGTHATSHYHAPRQSGTAASFILRRARWRHAPPADPILFRADAELHPSAYFRNKDY